VPSYGSGEKAAQIEPQRVKTPKAKRPFVRHDHAARLASGLDEHGGSVEGEEERGVLGLTQAEKATTTARGGDEPLRASVIRGRRLNRRKRWIATW